jgi:hypothetical protein
MRNNPVRRICLFLCTAFAAACSTDNPVPGERPAMLTEIRINPDIEVPAVTRARVTGTGFPNYYANPVDVRGSYGLFICRHEYGAPMEFLVSMAGSSNMRAMAEVTGAPASTSWSYSYSTRLDNSFGTVYINDEVYTADFYAYAPWIGNVVRPDNIAYSFTNQYDLMYATQNGTSNRDIPSDGTTQPVNFTFRHALACLRFELKTKYSGDNNVNLYYARLRKTAQAGTNTNLYSTGTFNAMNGSVSNLTGVTELTHDFTDIGLNSSTYTAFETLVVPSQDIDDGGMEVQFYTNGNITAETMKFTIARDHTKYNDGTNDCYGFRSGKVYTFRITLDNYLKLDGVTVTEDWTTEPERAITI